METYSEKLEMVKKTLSSYPDFPKPGVLFRDVFSVLRSPDAFQCLVDLIIERFKIIKESKKIDVIVGLDSRGFLFGPIISLHFQIPFIPVRKRGKLPGSTISMEFTLEYGKDVLEIQTDSVKPGSTAFVIDDLLATGGTMSTVCQLFKKIGVEVAECFVVIELLELKGREKIQAPIFSLIQY